MGVKIDLSNFTSLINDNFLPLLYDESPYLVLRGGAGSGKSIFCIQKILFRILYDYNKGFKHRIILLRKTRPYAKKSVWRDLKEMIVEWGLSSICRENKTDLMFTFTNGSSIECMGLDDPEKIKSIAGVTTMFMEEATEFTLDDFMQLDLRMRGKIDTYYQIMIAFNPTSKLSWVYKEFYANLKRYGDKAMLHLSTYLDNKFLDDKYKQKLEQLSERDYGWHQTYALGNWGSLENVIYKNWIEVKGFPEDIQKISLGLDFGYNHPMALTQQGFTEEGIFIKELIYESNLTINRLIDKMKKIIPDSGNQITRNTPIYCDNARPEAIAQIRNAGFNAISVKKGNNSVKEGIDLVKQHKLYITKGSTNIITEIQKYKWKEDKEGNVFEEPFKHYDDAMDAIRYSVFMTLLKRVDVGVLFMSI